MLFLTILSLVVTVAVTAASMVLFSKLRTTERLLERAQLRMARLDELADNMVARELDLASVTWPPADEVESPRERLNTPVNVESARDSGRFESVGFQFDSEALFGPEPEFAAPQMTSEVTEDRRQKPSRPRHQTPVGSPRNFTPRSLESIVAVGSIQVRSDEIARFPAD